MSVLLESRSHLIWPAPCCRRRRRQPDLASCCPHPLPGMLAVRQQSRGLARLAQLLQPQLPLACAAVQQAGWAQQPAAALHASAAQAALGGGGGITGWLTSKVSGMMGAGEMEDLDIVTFGDQIKKARRLGSLTGFVHGTAAVNDSAAQGTMRLFEQIIE